MMAQVDLSSKHRAHALLLCLLAGFTHQLSYLSLQPASSYQAVCAASSSSSVVLENQTKSNQLKQLAS
jgi:hypothetical protein